MFFGKKRAVKDYCFMSKAMVLISIPCKEKERVEKRERDRGQVGRFRPVWLEEQRASSSQS